MINRRQHSVMIISNCIHYKVWKNYLPIPLKFRNRYVISSHTLLAIWLLIDAEINLIHVSKRAPWSEMVITFSESLFISYEHIIIQPIDTNAPRVDSFKKCVPCQQETLTQIISHMCIHCQFLLLTVIHKILIWLCSQMRCLNIIDG